MNTNMPGGYHFSKKRFYETTWFKVGLGCLIGGGIVAGLHGCSNQNADVTDFKDSSVYAEMSHKIIVLQDSVDVYADSLLALQEELALARDSLADCHKRCPVDKKTIKKPVAPVKKADKKPATPAKQPAAPAEKTVQSPVVVHDTLYVCKPAAADVSVSGDNNTVVVGDNNTVFVEQQESSVAVDPVEQAKAVADRSVVAHDVLVLYCKARGRRR